MLWNAVAPRMFHWKPIEARLWQVATRVRMDYGHWHATHFGTTVLYGTTVLKSAGGTREHGKISELRKHSSNGLSSDRHGPFSFRFSSMKYIPAPGLPRVCFGIFSRVFMMTFMFISWYLQDFWRNHHHVWSQNVANSIVFYFFIIFHLYLQAFVNTRSRKRLFQDALYGFAFRHRETTKNSDFSVFFWRSTFTACSLEESRRVQVQETRSVA